MFSLAWNRWKSPLLTAAFVVGYAFGAEFCIHYVRNPSGISALWVSNSLLLSGLVLLRGNWRLVCAIGCALACFGLVAFPNGHYLYAAGAAAISAFVCLTGAWLVRRVCHTPRLRNMKQALKLLFLVIAPTSVLSGLLSAAWLHLRTGAPIPLHAFQWAAASFTGTSMLLPTLLMMATPSTARKLTRGVVEKTILGAAVAGMIAAPFVGFYMLSLVLVFPAANLFALRLGGKLTSMALTAITLIAFVYPFAVPGAGVQAEPDSMTAIIVGFQIYIIAVFYNGLFTSLAIDHQTRIKRQLEKRTAIARNARIRAQRASEAKTQFLAAMSHELRTPLNGVLGFTQILLQKKGLSKDVRGRLQLIQRSGDALLMVVNDILDYSRMEGGEIALKPAPASIGCLVDDAVEIARVEADAKGLPIKVTIEGDNGRVWNFDSARVRQILLNLLNNAVKFTPGGAIALNVVVGDDRARFSVDDTGVGIAPEKITSLFDGFTQVETGVRRSYGGAGLGLAISSHLVNLMGGTIGVESAPGEGSTFWFEIPLAAADGGLEETDDGDCRAAHILVVDDHPVNRELAITVLGLLGCTTDAVENGAEAVEALKHQTYDAVLMDVHMPVLDGIAATRAIRSLKGPAGRTPIIGLSADVLPESVERCLSAGMDDHLAKPVNVAKLQTALLRSFSGSDRPEETRAEAVA